MIVTPPPSCGSTAKALEELSPPALTISATATAARAMAPPSARRGPRRRQAGAGRGPLPAGADRVDERRPPRLHGGVVGKQG